MTASFSSSASASNGREITVEKVSLLSETEERVLSALNGGPVRIWRSSEFEAGEEILDNRKIHFEFPPIVIDTNRGRHAAGDGPQDAGLDPVEVGGRKPCPLCGVLQDFVGDAPVKPRGKRQMMHIFGQGYTRLLGIFSHVISSHVDVIEKGPGGSANKRRVHSLLTTKVLSLFRLSEHSSGTNRATDPAHTPHRRLWETDPSSRKDSPVK